MRVLALVTALLVLGVAPVHADGLLTPFVGAGFGGDMASNPTTYGVSLAGMAGGVFGFELDLGRTSDFQSGSQGQATVTTLLGGPVLGIPMGPVRPYAAAGFGLFRTRIASDADPAVDETSTDMGVHVGGGLLGFFSPRLGARVDLRYFRNVSGDEAGGSLLDFDLGAFDFWRATIGFILRF